MDIVAWLGIIGGFASIVGVIIGIITYKTKRPCYSIRSFTIFNEDNTEKLKKAKNFL